MKTQVILNNEKSEVVNGLINELKEHKAYKDGQQDAEENANNIYDNAMKLHNEVVRWWKLVLGRDGVYAYTQHSTEVVLVKDGSVVFFDEFENSNSVIHFCKRTQAIENFKGTRAEMIKYIESKQ